MHQLAQQGDSQWCESNNKERFVMNKLKESNPSVPILVEHITAREVYNYLSDDYTGSLEKWIIVRELTKLHQKRLSRKAEAMLNVRIRRIKEIRDKKSKLSS